MLECRVSCREDLPALAACHAKAFPEALSTKQGCRFVERMLDWYIDAERGVLFHGEADGKIVGYCGGLRVHRPGLPGAFTSISQHAFWAFVWAYLRRPWLILHPENLKKRRAIVRNILLRVGMPRVPAMPAVSETGFRAHWGLVVIGVDAAYQGRGYGKQLLEEFERLALADGAEYIRLSVRATNRGAIAFYRREGWTEVSRTSDALLMQKHGF